MKKKLTHAQVKSRQAQAVRMLTDVVEPPDLDRADEIASMTPQEYADHRGFELVENPKRRSSMASKADLEEQVQELESEVAELQDELDAIADIAAPPEEEDEGEGEGEEEN